MADINPTIKYDSDFSKVTADIKKLVREATTANAVFAQLNKSASAAKMQAAQSFSSQAGFAGFKAQIVDLTGATESFGQQLVKNKLTMKEYFSEAAKAYKKDSRARALAEREVRRAQSAVVGMGDINGQRKGMLITPNSLDMKSSNVQLQIASKQYEIFNDLVQRGSTAMVNWGKNTQWAGRQLTVGLTVPMGIFAGQALKAFSGLDAEVTRFRKVYGSDLTGTVGDATDQMISQIRGLGSEFAKQYGIASKETMALAADLAAAGLEGEKLANAVNQTTRMMVLGEVDRQEAMKATLSIQTAFNQSSKELAKSVDFLNAVENQTSASLQDLVEAIPKTGPVIQALGGDIKDLSILMTAMREGGISAGEGANALKSGMASLISPTSKAIEVAGKFGINLSDIVSRNKGELMPLLLDFQQALRGLDDFGKAQVIEQIFGKYQFARISALFDNLNAQGSQTIGMVKLMKASSDELAKKSYSELKAQENAPSTRLAAMQQQLQEQLIKVGADLAETLLPIMQGALDILSKIVDGFNNLPGPIKSFAKIIAGVTAAAGPILMLAGIFGNLIGNAIKFGMSIVNMFKRVTGHPVKTLQILTDEELAAKIAANQLTGAYDRQRTSIVELNAALDMYIANLKVAASIAPPGAVRPGGRGPIPPVRRQSGGVIYAQNGVDSGGRINGYGGGDTVPAMLEPGEFVINKKSSSKYAPLLRDINQGKDVPGYNRGTDNAVGNVFRSMNTNPNAKSTNIYKYLSDKEAVTSLTGLAEKNPGIIAQLKALPPSAEVTALLEAMRFSDVTDTVGKKFISGLAASHMAESGFAVKIGNDIGIKKNYIGTTALESYGYNAFIQDIAGGNSAREKAIGLSKKIPQGYPDRQKLIRMLSDVAAPIEPSDMKILNSFFNDIEKNPALRNEFLTNTKGKISKNKIDKFNEAKAYTGRLEELILQDEKLMAAGKQSGYTKYAEIRKQQIIGGTLAALPDSVRKQLVKSMGYDGLIRSLAAGAEKVVGPIATNSLKGSELRRHIRLNMLSWSEELTGRGVLSSIEKTRLEDAGIAKRRKSFVGRQLGAQSMEVLQKEQLGITRGKWAESQAMKNFLFFVSKGKIKGNKNGGLIKGYAGGGPIGNLLQIMTRSEQRALPNATEMLQKGFTVDRLDALEVAALRKKQTGLAHNTKMFRGGRYNWDAAEVGQTITIPGSRSWSTREDVADNFRAMQELGAEKRSATISTNELSKAGINPETFGRTGSYDMFRTATNKEEEYAINRIKRIEQIERQRRAFADIKKLEAEKKALMDSLYPSQESTLFGATEPKAFEVANRERELKELDRRIHGSRVEINTGREMSGIYRRGMKGRNEDPVIFEMVTPQGTQTLPLSDITGRGRSIKGMGQMDEFEHLLTDGTMRIVRKYIDERGVKRIVGEFVDAKRFAAGGQLPGYGGGDKVPALLEPGEFVINKKAAAANAPLLEQINSNMTQARQNGGGILKLQTGGPTPGFKGLNQRLGGTTGFMMNAMFLPMMLPMMNEMEGFTGALMKAVIGLQIFTMGLQAASMVSGVFGKVSAAKGIANAASRSGASAGMIAGGMGGGKLTQMAANFKAGNATGIFGKMGGLAATALTSPITLGIAAVAAVGVGLWMAWQNRLDQLKREAASAYQESTEMAKVYNIELNKTGKALQENAEYAKAYGIAAKNMGRGQVEKDYAKAIDKQYTDLITNIKEASSEEQKRNQLAAVYSSLIAQNFTKKQANEITAEIARQAQATASYAAISKTLEEEVNNVDDAINVMSSSLEKQMNLLKTSEERIEAIKTAYQNVVRISSKDPTAAVQGTVSVVNTAAENGGLKDLVTSELEAAGIDAAGRDAIFKNLFGDSAVNWYSKQGRRIGATILTGIQFGIDVNELLTNSLEGVITELSSSITLMDSKINMNKTLEESNKKLEKSINDINKKYDDQIIAIEKDKDAIIDGAEAKKKALEDEAKALQDRGDLIRENADLYLKMLEKEYKAEQYYQNQREQSLGGLKSLAEGDIFGYLQSQQQAASDAQQFGREQAIAQIEDTRDTALANIDARMKINQNAGDKLDEETQKALDGKDKQIQDVNTARSNLIKRIRDMIDRTVKIINDPNFTDEGKITKFQTKLQNLISDLPKGAKKAFEDMNLDLAEKLTLDTEQAGRIMHNVMGANVEGMNTWLNEQLGLTKTTGSATGQTTTTVTVAGDNNGTIDVTNGKVKKNNAGDKVGDLVGGGQPSPMGDFVHTTDGNGKYDIYKWNSAKNKYDSYSKGTLGTYLPQTSQLTDMKKLKQYLNRGGKAMRYNAGTSRMVSGFGNSDTVSAMLTPGEFVSDKTATRRNFPVLQAMNAGATFTIPQLQNYNGTMGSENETNNTSIDMPVNITINGANLTVDEVKKGIYSELMRAKNSLSNTIGGLS